VSADPVTRDLVMAVLSSSQTAANDHVAVLEANWRHAEATVDAIRDQVMDLLESEHAPSAAAIRRALYPSRTVVERYRGEAAS
jgi:hypothetical protein